METAPEHETTPESALPPRTTPQLESEQEMRPTPPPSPISSVHIESTNQESPPSSPQLEYLDEEALPAPPQRPAAADLDEDETERDNPGAVDPLSRDLDASDSDDETPPPSESDDDEPPLLDDENDANITLEDMNLNCQFFRMIEQATLEAQFSPAELQSFRASQKFEASLDNEDLRLSIKFFISTLDHLSSQKAYTSAHEDILERYPDSGMLSYSQVKKTVSDLSGVLTWKHDMCVDSCAAFTGPFEGLQECPLCHEPRYDQDTLEKSGGKKKVPRKVFTTFPFGPQLQARWKNPHTAEQMLYRRNRTRDLLEKRARGEDFIFDDILCGSDYLDAVENGKINDYDAVVMLSIDGAQFYRNKKSDCWIYIWILLDLAPDKRYKVRNILPGGIIPGPNNPKHLDSFLFPGLAHVSAIQKEGVRIWDSLNNVDALSLIFVLLVLADAVASAEVSGSVGHQGKRGCRIFCGLFGRNKPGGPHYYPVLLKPSDSNATGSNHPDIDINDLPGVDTSSYREDLNQVLRSRTDAEYQRRRLDSGIRKASLFGAIPRILRLPTCFPGDIMHQPLINLTALMFELWCEKGNCRKGDSSPFVWDWAVLKGNVWKAHGEAVAAAAPYFPRSFDRTPRNPAEKMSSGYKAWEFLLYFYGLGPGLFYGLLPEPYYKHYCKLVAGIRTMYQHGISPEQLQFAYLALLEWVVEFEYLYYRRLTERLHFVRQCIHSLVHLVPETLRIGPPSLYAQWTMERMIGILGSLIKQPSNPFANLAEQAKKVAEVNALIAIWPSLERKKNDPRGSIGLGDGRILLGPKDSSPYHLSDNEKAALDGFHSRPVPRRSVYRWARLQIPTGQVARSYWKEVIRTPGGSRRRDRNVKVHKLT